MKPLATAKSIRPPVKRFIAECMEQGYTRKQAKRMYNTLNPHRECWMNDEYVVLVYRGPDIPEDMNPDANPHLVWLSIRRVDREPVTDWRHKQQIKNQLIGEECEAVEIYPAESRLVDQSNQYHLFGLDNEARVPFGFQTRLVDDRPFCDSKQRKFDR